MAEHDSRLLEALTKINEVVDGVLRESEQDGGGGHDHDHGGGEPHASCVPKSLPKRLHAKAAEVAYLLNPVNSPALAPFGRTVEGVQPLQPLFIAALTSKYWGPRPRTLSVSFMETTPADLRRRIVSHLNAWTRTGCITFAETSGTGTIRISRGGGGYYSYLGTDVLLIPRNRQTMNLEGFTMNTSEDEFRRVVRHEAGHTLGFPHEHMRQALISRIDRQKAYEYFRRTQGWDQAMVDAQVLTPLDERSLLSTPPDQTSIMCYQLPGTITKDGRPILGGKDINANDHAFVGRIYPKAGSIGGFSGFGSMLDEQYDEDASEDYYEDDWGEAEDVHSPEEALEQAS